MSIINTISITSHNKERETIKHDKEEEEQKKKIKIKNGKTKIMRQIKLH